MKCKDCKWWEEKEGDKPNDDGLAWGCCHYNPPVATGSFLPSVNQFTNKVMPQLMETTIWARVSAAGWCGKWTQNNKEYPACYGHYESPGALDCKTKCEYTEECILKQKNDDRNRKTQKEAQKSQ